MLSLHRTLGPWGGGTRWRPPGHPLGRLEVLPAQEGLQALPDQPELLLSSRRGPGTQQSGLPARPRMVQQLASGEGRRHPHGQPNTEADRKGTTSGSAWGMDVELEANHLPRGQLTSTRQNVREALDGS